MLGAATIKGNSTVGDDLWLISPISPDAGNIYVEIKGGADFLRADKFYSVTFSSPPRFDGKDWYIVPDSIFEESDRPLKLSKPGHRKINRLFFVGSFSRTTVLTLSRLVGSQVESVGFRINKTEHQSGGPWEHPVHRYKKQLLLVTIEKNGLEIQAAPYNKTRFRPVTTAQVIVAMRYPELFSKSRR